MSDHNQKELLKNEFPYPHLTETIGTIREIYDAVLSPEIAVNTFRNIDRLFPVRNVASSANPWSLPQASAPLPPISFIEKGIFYDIDDFLELNKVSAILILENGTIKMERYRFGNSANTRWMSMSIAKSITSVLFGAAMKQGYISDLSDPVTLYVPSLKGSVYENVSLRNILMMSSGVKWDETYTSVTSDRRRLLEAQISLVPGSALKVIQKLSRIAEPGTVHNYNTGETQIAAEILRNAIGQPLSTYLSERIWARFGMESDAKWWLDSPDGVEIGGSGLSATLRDYGRFGLFLLNNGVVNGEAILPDGWISESTTPKTLTNGTSLDYGYLWWTAPTSSSKKERAFMAWGIFGQFIYINPVAQVVIVVWSAQQHPTDCVVINNWTFCDAMISELRNTRQN